MINSCHVVSQIPNNESKPSLDLNSEFPFKNAFVSSLKLPDVNGPAGILVIPHSGELIFADKLGKQLKCWSRIEGDSVETIQKTRMNEVQEITLSVDGKFIYLIDSGGSRSRPALHRFDILNQSFHTLTNNRKQSSNHTQNLENPRGISRSQNGKTLYIANTDDHTILSFDIETNSFSLLCGKSGESGGKDGDLNDGRLNFPDCITVSDDGQTLFVSEVEKVRQIELESDQKTMKTITTIYKGLEAGRGISFLGIWNDIARIGVVDYLGNCIKILKQKENNQLKWELELTIGNKSSSSTTKTMQIDGTKATFNNPVALFFERNEKVMFVSDESNNCIRKIYFNPQDFQDIKNKSY